jgi:CheY-like chemotaxis protein
MSAVLGIVRRHDGALQVDSTPGKGSTFTLLLPAAAETSGETDAGMAVPNTPAQGHGTILFVDDEKTVRTLGERMLTRMGYTVLAAENGRHAIELFQESGSYIDLVVLDLTMPYMGGEQTLKHLRELREDIPVVLSSGYAEAEISARFDPDAIQGFIQKPFRIQALQELLAKILS